MQQLKFLETPQNVNNINKFSHLCSAAEQTNILPKYFIEKKPKKQTSTSWIINFSTFPA